MTLISSKVNPLIVSACSLRDRKNRENKSRFFFEGKKLLEEALSSPSLKIDHIFMTENALESFPAIPNENVIQITSQVADKLSLVGTNDGIFCVAQTQKDLHGNSGELLCGVKSILLLSSIRDPGNMGTIIRTAYAFGIDTLVVSSDCADIYNPKTIRGAMGMLFRQKIYISDKIINTIKEIQSSGFKVYAASMHKSSVSLQDVKLPDKSAFVLGNEGHGIDEGILSSCDCSIYIPMVSGAESLNVSSAACVLCWELFKK